MADYISHEAPAHESTTLPVMVPQKLVGRDAILGQIYTRLRENKPLLLYGAAGVGKTALAATLAAAYTEQPGGVLWLNVDNATVDELIVRVGRAYDVTEITRSEYPLGMVGAVASTLTQHKPLIVLDGVLNEEMTTAFITRCIEGLPVLLVNQQPIGADSWPAIHLEPLEAGHAATLFKQAAGQSPDPDPSVDQLVQTLRYMPMAIAIAGSTIRANKQSPTEYFNALKQIPNYGNADPSLVALTAAFRSLNSALQGLMLMLGATFRGEASAELLSKVGNAPQETIQQVMRILAHQHLVELTQRYNMPYYRLHPLAHRFTQTLAGPQRVSDLRSKLKDALLHYADQYSVQGDDDAHDHLALMMDNFLAVGSWAAQDNNLEVANNLVVALMSANDFINERGYVYELLQLRRMAATSTSAFPASPAESFPEMDDEETEDERAPQRPPSAFISNLFDEDEEDDDLVYDEDDDELEADDEDEAIERVRPPLRSPASLFGPVIDEADDEDDEDDDYEDEDDDDLEDDNEEYIATFIPEIPTPDVDQPLPKGDIVALRALLATARQRDDRERQLEILQALGTAQVDAGQQTEAIATYTDIVALYDDNGDDEDLLDALDTLATLIVNTGNPQPAILHANRGIQLAERLDDDETRMHISMTLGDARQDLGESSAAETAYSQALEIARNTGDKQNEAIILYKLGYAQLDNSDPEGASATWEQALTLFRAQEKRDYEGKVLGGLGTAYGEQGQWAEATRFHTSALHIAREVDDQDEENQQLGNLAYAAVQANDLGQGVLRYRQALHLAYEQDDREGIVSTIVDLAGLLTRSPRHLEIARLLVDDAARLEPHDRDVLNLQERITAQMQDNAADQKPVNGTAQAYAENAYKLLDN